MAEQAPADKPSWNVMVFMGAGPVPGETDLLEAAQADIEEMKKLFETQHEGPLNLFAQLNAGGQSGRYDIRGGTEDGVPAGERDPTNGNALIAFMRWALGIAGDREDTNSMLVLWGHAYEFAIGRAVRPTGIDALDFSELADVLDRIQRDRGRRLNVVGFDACDLATIEIAYQFYPYADYMLASEIGIPIPGWPYDRVLERLVKPAGHRGMGPAELGAYVVRRYCEAYSASDLTVSLTMLDLSRAAEIVAAVEELSRKLVIAMASDADEFSRTSESFIRSQTAEDKPFVDVADLCLNLLRDSADSAVRNAAEKVGDLLISPGPVFPGQSESGLGRPFILEHGRNACQTAKLQGASLYAPHVAPSHDFESADPFYGRLAFTKETLWSDVVHALANANA